MEEAGDMKKSEICIYLIGPVLCFVVLISIFLPRDVLYAPIEYETTEPIEFVAGDGKIDINTANETTLGYLPGIGPSTAERIVKYRQMHGPFRKIEDLKKISGIGDATFHSIRKFIKVGE